MCAATVQLRIQWRLPFWPAADDELETPEDDGGDGEEELPFPPPVAGMPGNLFPELQVGANINVTQERAGKHTKAHTSFGAVAARRAIYPQSCRWAL